jgi:Xaa-Pro aminopeptidase
LLVFRESSDPEYPGTKLDTFNTVLEEALGGNKPLKIGIAGWSLIPHTIFKALSDAVKCYGEVEIFKADRILTDMRAIKTENELRCMREAYRICELTFGRMLENIKPGMTETQVRGLALGIMHELGAESEAYPFWVLCGNGSEQAISRARNKVLTIGELIQIQIGVRVAGYVSTIGRPVIFGKAPEKIRDLMKAGLAAQQAVLRILRAGIPASSVTDAYYSEMERIGYRDWLLYGPCHGTGLMEGEPPWMESNSEWILKENMTFCTCIFLGKPEEGMGLRFEDGVRILTNGVEEFSNYRREIIEL